MEELLKSLIDIQQNLNAPKDQYNQFGKFKYRKLEDIQAAIKPLLAQHSCGIRFADEIVEHCGRTFLKTTLTFFNEKGETLSTTAEAEHAPEKSGMDVAQISGAASSYARKYAMNALFLLDDSPDMDSEEYGQGKKTRKTNTIPKSIPSTPQPPVDKNTAIKNAINASKDVNALLSLYIEHQQEVESNPEIKAMFSARRQALPNQ